MGPLIEELTHVPPLHPTHFSCGGIATVPVRDHQQASRSEDPQQLVGVVLLVGHMGPGLHTPDRVEAPI